MFHVKHPGAVQASRSQATGQAPCGRAARTRYRNGPHRPSGGNLAKPITRSARIPRPARSRRKRAWLAQRRCIGSSSSVRKGRRNHPPPQPCSMQIVLTWAELPPDDTAPRPHWRSSPDHHRGDKRESLCAHSCSSGVVSPRFADVKRGQPPDARSLPV